MGQLRAVGRAARAERARAARARATAWPAAHRRSGRLVGIHRAAGKSPGRAQESSRAEGVGGRGYLNCQGRGPPRLGGSLGVYRTEEAAQARLAALRDQGVRSAQVGARETGVPKIWLQVKGVDPALQ